MFSDGWTLLDCSLFNWYTGIGPCGSEQCWSWASVCGAPLGGVMDFCKISLSFHRPFCSSSIQCNIGLDPNEWEGFMMFIFHIITFPNIPWVHFAEWSWKILNTPFGAALKSNIQINSHQRHKNQRSWSHTSTRRIQFDANDNTAARERRTAAQYAVLRRTCKSLFQTIMFNRWSKTYRKLSWRNYRFCITRLWTLTSPLVTTQKEVVVYLQFFLITEIHSWL